MITGTLHWQQRDGHLVLGDAEGRTVSLPLDGAAIAQRFFAHSPLRPVEIERAIDVIEDALMSIAAQVQAPTAFATSDAALCSALGAAAGERLSVEDVESRFQRQAAIALGSPLGPAEHALSTREVAALLLLRETMHHLGVPAVRIDGRRPGADQ